MIESLEMKTPVYEEEREPLPQRDAVLFRLALGAPHIHENLAFRLGKGKRKHVGAVRFVTVLFVDPLREKVPADDEGELVSWPEDFPGDILKRQSPRRRAGTNRRAYRNL